VTISTNISIEDILNLLSTGVSVGLQLLPAIEGIVNDWRNGTITAEEADAKANGQFSAMALALANVKKDEADTRAETQKEIDEKFPPAGS